MGSTYADNLRKAGMLNDISGPLENARRVKARGNVVAYCVSDRCCGKKQRAVKDVPKTEVDCPDCGYALFWGDENEATRSRVSRGGCG